MAIFNGHWTHGFGIWAVEHRETGALIARIGCHFPVRMASLRDRLRARQNHWGAGYATEGAAAALMIAREQCRPDRIISLIRPDNAGSIRVAERLGAVLDGDIEFFGGLSLVYNYGTIG